MDQNEPNCTEMNRRPSSAGRRRRRRRRRSSSCPSVRPSRRPSRRPSAVVVIRRRVRLSVPSSVGRRRRSSSCPFVRPSRRPSRRSVVRRPSRRPSFNLVHFKTIVFEEIGFVAPRNTENDVRRELAEHKPKPRWIRFKG